MPDDPPRSVTPAPFAAPTLPPPVSAPPPTLAPTSRDDLVLVELGGIKESLRTLNQVSQTMWTEIVEVKKTSEQALTTAQRAHDDAQRALRAVDSASSELAAFRDATARHIEQVTEPLKSDNKAIRDQNTEQTRLLQTIRASSTLAKYVTPTVLAIVTLLANYYGRNGPPQGLLPTPQPTVTVMVPGPLPTAPTSVVPSKP